MKTTKTTNVGPVLNVQMQGHALRTLSRSMAPLTRVATLCVVAALLFLAPPAAMAMGLAGAVLDERTEFCDATALNTGAAGSYLIGDVIDIGVVRDIGQGRPLYLVITVDTAVTSGGAATVQFALCSDAQAAIAVDASQTIHWQSAAIAKATLVAGYVVCVVPVPAENPAYEEFLGIVQTTGTAALTAGKVNAFLTADYGKWKAYNDAI